MKTKKGVNRMRNEFEFLIPIVFFLSFAGVIYHFIKARHTERIAVIEKGLTEEQLSYFQKSKSRIKNPSEWTIKMAALLISVGLAILIGNMFSYDIRDEIILGLIFLFPGIGLLLVYRYLEKKVKNNDNEE